MEIIAFKPDMQQSVDDFFSKCFFAVGIPYSPMDRHADIANVELCYMQDGCFWCLFDNQTLIGTVALRTYFQALSFRGGCGIMMSLTICEVYDI